MKEIENTLWTINVREGNTSNFVLWYEYGRENINCTFLLSLSFFAIISFTIIVLSYVYLCIDHIRPNCMS